MNHYNIIHDPGYGHLDDRLTALYQQVTGYLADEQQHGRQIVSSKVFLSDIANQETPLMASPLVKQVLGKAALTIIQQSPVGGAKVAVLLETGSGDNPFVLHSLRLTDEEVMNHGSYVQTIMLFDKYAALLNQQGLNLRDHCVRTWIYVRDIDTNYAGMVKARNDVFRQYGLTADTHFIASTGIGGRSAGRNVTVAIDFLTCPTVRQENVRYLKALNNLNPTHEYGVAFERGTRIVLPDNRQMFFISGTASIDHHGEVLFPDDVDRQTQRLLDNIEALLADGGAALGDVCYFVIYLRDLADAQTVDDYMQRRFPTVPRVVTYAQVCRPAWLVEMECVAEK